MYRKSAQVAVNTTAQAITAAGTTLNVLGIKLTNTGCSISTLGNGFKINDGGLYKIRYVITVTPTAAGTLAAQLFVNGTALPCSLIQNTVAANTTYTYVIEAPAVCVQACCAVQPIITATVSGVAADVTYVSASAVRLA